MAYYFVLFDIYRLNFAADKANIRPLTKFSEIDVTVIKVVMTGNQARQHARVRGISIFTDQGNSDARQWFHAQFFKNCNMAMATADQN
jgi:hypothetical protein